jgi:hypothetical protein
MISKRTIGILLVLVLLIVSLKLYYFDNYTVKKIISNVLAFIIVITITLGMLYIINNSTLPPATPLYVDINGNTHTTLSLYKLSPYIARKIYDLAVLENEECSITHEKFTLGNVAVMPCGHIYSKTALCTYFFTINDKKCLICKYDGIPVYL